MLGLSHDCELPLQVNSTDGKAFAVIIEREILMKAQSKEHYVNITDNMETFISIFRQCQSNISTVFKDHTPLFTQCLERLLFLVEETKKNKGENSLGSSSETDLADRKSPIFVIDDDDDEVVNNGSNNQEGDNPSKKPKE